MLHVPAAMLPRHHGRYDPSSLQLYVRVAQTLIKDFFSSDGVAADVDSPGVQCVVPVTIRDLQLTNAV